jgi:hypothetical protein
MNDPPTVLRVQQLPHFSSFLCPLVGQPTGVAAVESGYPKLPSPPPTPAPPPPLPPKESSAVRGPISLFRPKRSRRSIYCIGCLRNNLWKSTRRKVARFGVSLDMRGARDAGSLVRAWSGAILETERASSVCFIYSSGYWRSSHPNPS